MKGISIAIETIVYLILAVAVLSVLLPFFLMNATPGITQIELERQKNEYCTGYATNDPTCTGKNGNPVDTVKQDVINNIRTTCLELNRHFSFSYKCDGDMLTCIKNCCNIACPKS